VFAIINSRELNLTNNSYTATSMIIIEAYLESYENIFLGEE